jgi:MOSC domain-containing protein YiiM
MNPSAQSGTVVGIFVAEAATGAIAAAPAAQLEAGRGIAGDRYHAGVGTFSPGVMDPEHQLTLVEAEKIDAYNAAHGGALGYGDFRRNIVTRGVDLNALVGVEFRVGAARVRGVRLCEPCSHLAGLVGAGVLETLVHRAGLRAAILEGVVVRPGDPVETPGP